MLLTQDQEMIRDAVRAFAQEELWPHAAKWDKEHHFPKEAHQGLAALGAYGICVPEEYGGAHLNYLTLALVLEEIAAGDGGTSTAISVTNCPVNAILMRYGNAAQKKQWLTRLAQGELLGAFCLTEPHVGSDASALRTTAVKEGDGYVINGVKQFITSGTERRRGDRHRRHRQGRGQERHERLPRAHQRARLRGGAARRQAGPAQQRHRADQLRQLPHPGGEPDRR
jgi:butyryl-CoA dehydrogenase